MSIGKPRVAPLRDAEDLGRARRLFAPERGAASRAPLAFGEIENPRPVSLLDRFDRDVRRLYPASHPVFVAGTDPTSGESTTRLTSIGQLAKVLRSFRGSHYSIVIPGRKTGRRAISTASLAEVFPTRYEGAANQLSVEKERTASGPWRRRRRRRRGRRP